jgi:D-sedoheptulose 7-phosphate isomerase
MLIRQARGAERDRAWARAELLESARTTRQLAETGLDEILLAAHRIADCLRAGGKVMLCGNGGSAAHAQHLAAEFTNRLRPDFDRPPLAALALTADSCFLTSHANDYAYVTVFARQVYALGRRGDVLIAITTSGNSENVRRASLAARALGICSIGFLGGDGGRVLPEVELGIVVPGPETHHVQEGHIALGHVIVGMVERLLFKPDASDGFGLPSEPGPARGP